MAHLFTLSADSDPVVIANTDPDQKSWSENPSSGSPLLRLHLYY